MTVLFEQSQVIVQLDVERRTAYVELRPEGAPNFNLQLLESLKDWVFIAQSSKIRETFDYVVYQSATPAVFNLGGDLEYFASCVDQEDWAALDHYAKLCVDLVYANYNGYIRDDLITNTFPPLTTIADVQGLCLGGGFEMALSCNYIVASSEASFGFPEIRFGLFPGMGALQLLQMHMPLEATKRFILSGEVRTFQDDLPFAIKAGHTLEVEALLQRIRQKAAAYRFVQGYGRKELDIQDLYYVAKKWVQVAKTITSDQIDFMRAISERQRRKYSA